METLKRGDAHFRRLKELDYVMLILLQDYIQWRN